jgi:uncharacterized membrane protein
MTAQGGCATLLSWGAALLLLLIYEALIIGAAIGNFYFGHDTLGSILVVFAILAPPGMFIASILAGNEARKRQAGSIEEGEPADPMARHRMKLASGEISPEQFKKIQELIEGEGP